ncbi:phage tail protein [Kribbella sp. NPDC051952]|uniref:phage tail protein n=1 Tax=Kribbella sp. NPDC051952 TaxID=3154851 RepID=UPI00343C4004
MGRQLRGVSGCDQWVRATHEHTAVDGETGRVGLSWTVDDIGDGRVVLPAVTRGLAFDRFCRAYRGVTGNITRTLLGDTRAGVDYATLAQPLELLAGGPEPAGGDTGFAPSQPVNATALDDPVGVVVTADDRLVISERGRQRLLVLDLWSRRIVRTIRLDTPNHPAREPWGVAAFGRDVWVATRNPAGLLRFTGRGEPVTEPLPVPSQTPAPDGVPGAWAPSRVTVAGDILVLLYQKPSGEGLLVAAGRPALAVGPASDLATDAEGMVVVAPAAGGRALQRFAVLAGRFVSAESLDAAGYDGGGIALTHQGRIAYTTEAGFRLAVRGRLRYAGDGRVVTFRLDSGEYGTRWGRLFLDAHLPPGTTLRCSVLTSDDEDAAAVAAVAAIPADPQGCDPYRPELTPPLPPPRLDLDVPLIAGAVQERPSSPVPWWRPAADDCMTSYEGYPSSAAGRYAWIAVRLTGNTRATPLVGAVRIESEAHTLMRRLPMVFSAEPAQESFLHRYLAMFDGILHDLDQRSLLRELLLDPASAPEEALDWLASFVGMVLDERWPLAARRQLLAEAATLYRRRGTLGALSRYLELYLGVAPVIVEHYRLRGLAAGSGLAEAGWAQSVVGFGYRVGGAIGTAGRSPARAASAGAVDASQTPFSRQAHRFSVIVPRLLDEVQDAVVRLVLERERPAHTAYELCTVDAGMRVGRSMHLGLTSVVGRTGGFDPAMLGTVQLGGAGILGGGLPGAVAEAARAGKARVG